MNCNPTKQIHQNGRVIEGTNDKFIIKILSNQPFIKNVKCEDCGRAVKNTYIRIYKPNKNFTVFYKIVCSICCSENYSAKTINQVKMNVVIKEKIIEEMTYHTEVPEEIYQSILTLIKPEIIKFIKHIISKKSHYDS